jgi:hypothetical protein
MPKPKNDQHKEYSRYAAHCLDMTTSLKDQTSRNLAREMAAEWIKLAEALRHPLDRDDAVIPSKVK